MPFKMSSFVFWSGVYNAALAFFLRFPPLRLSPALHAPSPNAAHTEIVCLK
jgi:hypothetical protein